MKNIRAHHLICMSLFEGAGYDEAFAENMKAVIAELENGEAFTIAERVDDICKACPNNHSGSCELGDRDVADKDKTVLEACGLGFGSELNIREMQKLLLNSFSPEAFDKCCRTCRWHKLSYCSYESLINKLTKKVNNM